MVFFTEIVALSNTMRRDCGFGGLWESSRRLLELSRVSVNQILGLTVKIMQMGRLSVRACRCPDSLSSLSSEDGVVFENGLASLVLWQREAVGWDLRVVLLAEIRHSKHGRLHFEVSVNLIKFACDVLDVSLELGVVEGATKSLRDGFPDHSKAYLGCLRDLRRLRSNFAILADLSSHGAFLKLLLVLDNLICQALRQVSSL